MICCVRRCPDCPSPWAVLLFAVVVLLVSWAGVASATVNVDLENERLARWEINYASYLTDVGKYFEALEYYESAYELSTIPRTRAETLLAEAQLLSAFLDDPNRALEMYRKVIDIDPALAETAMWRKAFLYYHLQSWADARAAFSEYLSQYPQGRYRFQAEAIARMIPEAKPVPKQETKPRPKPAPMPQSKPVVIPEPNVVVEPKVTVKPEVAVEPEVAAKPEAPVAQPVAPKAQQSAEPKPAPKIEVKKPEPVAAPKPQAQAVELPPVQPLRDEPFMRVGMCRGRGEAVIAGEGGLVCADGLGCARSFRVVASGGALLVNGKRLSSAEFSPQGSLKVSCGPSKKVRGTVSATMHKGRLLLVNRLPMEDYLLSVVPSESYPSWPEETLKAQSIAARTYAYYQKTHRTKLPYDVVDNEGDQMYGGMDREHKRTTKAIRATRGMVLTHEERPILSQYTANSGGYTADAGAVFGATKPYLQAKPDPASLKGKMANWSRSYATSEIVEKLAKRGISVPGLREILPEERGPSGRIIKVRLVYDGGSRVLRTRTSLASSRVLQLPEILLEIRKTADGYEFGGHGHGHGVGYSQWGAAELGRTMDHAEVLKFYYTGATLKRMW